MKYKKGDKYLLPTSDELKKIGWRTLYNSKDFTPYLQYKNIPIINCDMISFLGTCVTIKDRSVTGCYTILEDVYFWPLEVFDETRYRISPDGCLKFLFEPCEEGITPIDGYFICKHCGENMRKIHK